MAGDGVKSWVKVQESNLWSWYDEVKWFVCKKRHSHDKILGLCAKMCRSGSRFCNAWRAMSNICILASITSHFLALWLSLPGKIYLFHCSLNRILSWTNDPSLSWIRSAKLTVLLTTITFPIFYAIFGLDFGLPLKRYDIERSTALHIKILGVVEVHLGFSSLLEYWYVSLKVPD